MEGQSQTPVTKPALASKTYWAGLVLGAAAEFWPSFGLWVSAHPQSAMLAAALLMGVLRHFTTTGVHYAPKA